ncbi:cobalt-precorrin-6A reductase [Roseobacter sp. CCS2]|uniref:cobalt-precorrin-6A reductase n=1 Tax=Roseobacter sp. CCS2 TaxID=391593 RepID=UPI0000F3C6A3|nr:cobalt-precorrin-6A reductase [Roseobacter sp. CCS2]EBA11756.1 precorrin-6x reductase [Roseobacter sp. CCS2]
MTLLLLGGTNEARQIATHLQGHDAVISLAGATRHPQEQPLPTRVGGFGGEAGFISYLQEAGITAVLDATHPYAQQITVRTAQVCRAHGLPYVQFLRPPWTPEPGDQWVEISAESDAVDYIPRGSVVFLGTGRQTLHRFANLEGCEVVCRQIDPPTEPFPFVGGQYLFGRPPFSVEDEIALFQDLGVDFLVVKNAGGAPSRTKLTAARQLGLPVLMIARPAPGDWPVVESINDALAWVRAL